MKTFKMVLLTLLLTFAPFKHVNAGIGAVIALLNPAVGGTIALSGLALSGAGLTVATLGDGEYGPVILGGIAFYAGLVILDEENGAVSFTQVDELTVAKLKLDPTKVVIYNSEIEEANVLLDEVSSSLNADSTVEEAKELWSELSDLVSPETFEIMQDLVTAI